MASQATDVSLAFYKIGGDRQVWTPIAQDVGHGMLHDLTYYKGKFYVVHNGGYVVVVNGLEETQEETPDTSTYLEKIINYLPGDIAFQHYILESLGDLLVVRRLKASSHSDEGYGGIPNPFCALFQGLLLLLLNSRVPSWLNNKNGPDCT
ncbi:hypothetical protein IFM89_031906 [Coptis chinensis]|uniref:KIB1-4 beta-propeller domain-containing protein n=1 Tax=Coptis chinensis TaxID=261450 RepID=A0A835IUG7_9MAGN|nr:hypothetical protein IFM89_031906 [Coptis chinensis]